MQRLHHIHQHQSSSSCGCNVTRLQEYFLDPHRRPQKCFQGDNVDVLLIVFRLLTMQCKLTFTNRFTSVF